MKDTYKLIRRMLRPVKRWWNDIKVNRQVMKYDVDNMPVFQEISIETLNRCNGKCEFCPVNVNQPQRPYAQMPQELFQKIIDELHFLNYENRVLLSSNNEPFLDKRILDFAVYTREKLPKAKIAIWTNGSVISDQQLSEALGIFDQIYIDSYSTNGALTPQIARLVEFLQEKCPDSFVIYEGMKMIGRPEAKKILIFNRDEKQVLSSRGGNAPNKKDTNVRNHRKCEWLFNSITIRPDGKVSLCCSDALGQWTLGDVTTESLADIWFRSKKYHKVREIMQKEGRKALMLCDHCDF